MSERVRQFLGHPAHWVAMGFGAGLSAKAPGTVGTLWAWAAYLVLQTWLNPLEMGGVILGALLVGWWACTVAARRLARAGPGWIVMSADPRSRSTVA